jgi:hypothetical protein
MTSEIDKRTEAMKEHIAKMMQNFKLPDIDISAQVDAQRRNIEPIVKAAQVTNEAATEVSQRQFEIFRTASEHLSVVLRDIRLSEEQRREIATRTIESALASARELAELTANSNEVFELVKQRMTDNFEQMRKMFLGGSRTS